MEKKNNANVKKIIIAVCVVVFLVASVFLAKFFIDKNDEGNVDVSNNPSTEQTETTEPEPRPDYSEYVVKNPETVGWITIPGTKINAPVLQTVDNDYYMNHNFEQKKQ